MNSLLKSCIIIFCGRIVDVSFGTLKTVLTVKEKTFKAAMCGFIEVLTWFIIVRDALNSDAPLAALALSYACGYACGTLVGGRLSEILISGHITIEVITSDRSDRIPTAMRNAGYVLTVINVNESEFGSPKYMIIADLDKKKVKEFEERVHELDPAAYILLRETKGHIAGLGYSKLEK